MQTRLLLPAVVAAGLLCGCANQPPSKAAPPSQNCSGDCDIDVDASNGAVPEKVIVSNGRGKKIRWRIGPGMGVFATNGIEFDAAGQRIFTNCTPSPNWRMYTCDNSGGVGQYKYTVRLLWRAAYDPFIINE